MGKVRVIFSRRRQLGSLALRTFMWSAWSHCGIVDDETGEVIEALMFKGVTTRTLDQFKAAASKCEIIEIPTDNPEGVIKAARARIGCPYDWLGVLALLLHIRMQNPTMDFCSELVVEAFKAAGTVLFRTEAWRIMPRDLYIRTY